MERSNVRWHGHPVVARLIRIAIFVIPFLTAMVVAFVLSTRLPVASSRPGNVLRWLGIVVVSTCAMALVDRIARRFLPLSVLLRLTLVFPDQAPSRLAIAMRTGTTAQLSDRLEAARVVPDDETPQEAAERLLELVGLLSHHDRVTRGHSERVRAYSHLIGEEMGLTESELDKLRWAGLLHDVGKTAISTVILNKPGRLTDEEREALKIHPEEGRTLVAPLADWLGDSVRAVWEHHERFDGQGYPRGLSGTDISFAARVVSVADSYDVMTSARSYKKPFPAAVARTELAACAGSQFDPVVVRSFLNISLGRLRLMTGPLAWFAQLALFEPSGVVHAGSSSIQSGGAGSTGAATAGTAASTGTAGVTSTVAATAASVVASTAGFVAASPPVERVDSVAVVQTSSDGSETADLAVPTDTVVVLDRGEARFSTVTTTTAPESTAGSDDDDSGADRAVENEPNHDASRSSETGPPNTQPAEPGSEVVATTTPATEPASTPTSASATIPTTSEAATTTTTTTSTSVPPSTSTTTTTTTTTTSTTTVPAGSGTSRLFLGGDVTNSTTAPAFHNLRTVSPPNIPLPNFDTDRDSAPGVLIVKDAAGINGSDPTKVLKFAGVFSSTFQIDGNVHVDVYAAPRAFSGADIVVEVGVYACGSLGGCSLIGADTREYRDAVDWTKKKFHIHGVQATIDVGEWLEVRVAVLDSSEDDAWFAFGTDSFDARLDFPGSGDHGDDGDDEDDEDDDD